LAVDHQQSADDVSAELRAENARLRDERDRLRGKLDARLHQLYGRRCAWSTFRTTP
jgi:predicted  nucleic acid-binding Zn-ribbon protein